MLKAYGLFLRKSLDIKSSTTRQDFWLAFLIQFSLIISSYALAWGSDHFHDIGFAVSALLVNAWLLFTAPADITLFIRRFRDTGKPLIAVLGLVIPVLGIFYGIYLMSLPSEGAAFGK
jgi:uncharacterized membrane protein YhaH (DUF805 family)